MLKLIIAGGWGMSFVILFALLNLAAAIGFAWRGKKRTLAVLRALTATTVFMIFASIAANFTAVMWNAPRAFADDPKLPLIIMQGLGEVVTPATLGFSLLSMAWLIVAVGLRRFDDANP
jgi:hypothetical protein